MVRKKTVVEKAEVEEVKEVVEAEDKKYIVIRSFSDLKNNNKVYYNGDSYEGTDARIKELSSTKNKQGHALIKEV